LADLVLMEKLGIRSGPYGVIDATETVKKNHDVSLRIDETQENPITFEELGMSSSQGEECNPQIN
jgi:hypothetical protein